MRASRASASTAQALAAQVVWPLLHTKLARDLLPQLSRYTLVSALALGLDAAVLLALVHGAGLRASIAGLIGYAAGLVLHFALSTRFVFKASAAAKSRARLFAEFAATGVVGLAITGGVLWLASDVAGVPAIVAKAAAVAISFATVFALRRTVVFRAR